MVSLVCLGVLLLPPGWEASPHRITPQQYVAGTLLYTWVKREKVEWSSLSKETMCWARLSHTSLPHDGVVCKNLYSKQCCQQSFVVSDHGTCLHCTGQLPITTMYIQCGEYCSAFRQPSYSLRICVISLKLCSSNARWPMAPNFSSRVTWEDIIAPKSLQFFLEHSLVHVHVSVMIKNISPNPF